MGRGSILGTALATAVLVGTAGSGAAAAAGDGWSSLEQLGFTVPSTAQIAKSVRHFSVDGSVTSFATKSAQGSATTLTLSADLLFDVDKAELTQIAIQKIGDLVQNAPVGARMSVTGYTDSTGTAAHNQELSKRRAQAVAAAIDEARPDLKLTVTGRGETNLAQPEAGDDIALDRHLNRRVTVVWAPDHASAPG
jgi:OmpA-OmpF porin, OOP family